MTSSVKFSEIAELVMGQSPKGADCNETGDGFPLLNGPTEFTERSPLPVQFTTAGKKFSKTGDILFCVRGSTTGRMNYADQAYAIGRGIGAIRGINGYPTAYIRAVLEHNLDRLLVAATGSTFPNVGKDLLNNFEVNVCSPEQAQQANKLLVGIEDKRYLNSQTNQTLEEMAQAIFKSWFVDFDPVKAKINGDKPEGMDEATASLFPEKLDSETGLPEGWKLSEIGDEVTVVGGGTPSKKNDDFWVDGHIHWTSPKDLSGVQDKVLLDTTSKVTEAGLKKISSGLLPVDTVLLSSRAPVGYLALAKVPMAINQGYIAMKCEKLLPPEFVIQWCVHRMDEIKQRASGSTFAEISKKSFKPISVVVPSEDTLNAYQKMVKPLYDAITSNARQNEQLSSLRDTLLPKLLSGELSISD